MGPAAANPNREPSLHGFNMFSPMIYYRKDESSGDRPEQNRDYLGQPTAKNTTTISTFNRPVVSAQAQTIPKTNRADL
jgi:hypothetical protein